jgi:hypothetical protein
VLPHAEQKHVLFKQAAGNSVATPCELSVLVSCDDCLSFSISQFIFSEGSLLHSRRTKAYSTTYLEDD